MAIVGVIPGGRPCDAASTPRLVEGDLSGPRPPGDGLPRRADEARGMLGAARRHPPREDRRDRARKAPRGHRDHGATSHPRRLTADRDPVARRHRPGPVRLSRFDLGAGRRLPTAGRACRGRRGGRARALSHEPGRAARRGRARRRWDRDRGRGWLGSPSPPSDLGMRRRPSPLAARTRGLRRPGRLPSLALRHGFDRRRGPLRGDTSMSEPRGGSARRSRRRGRRADERAASSAAAAGSRPRNGPRAARCCARTTVRW